MEPVIEENEMDEKTDAKKESSVTITTCVEEPSSDDEETSSYDQELETSVNNDLANPAQIVRSQTTVGTFGEVKIENSQDVHFGNKIFTAPITVVNAIGEEEQDKLGILERKNIWERWKRSLKKTSKRERIAMSVLVFLVVIIVIITTVISSQMSSISNSESEETESATESVTSEPYDCLIPRIAWTSLPPQNINDVEPGAEFAIILHTATSSCKNPQDCAQAARTAQNYHINVLGYSDIGYNFLVGGDGFIYEGRGWGKEGAHTYGYNKRSVGIGFIGKYHDIFPAYDTPTPDQIYCTRRLLEEGVELGWLASNYSLVGYCDLLIGVPPGNVLLREIRNWSHYRKDGNPGTCTKM